MGTCTPCCTEESVLDMVVRHCDGMKVDDSTDFVRLPLRDALKCKCD